MEFWIVFLFLLIGLHSFINLFYKDKRVYSINKFLYLYALIFWSIIPFFQYSIGVYPWRIRISDADALTANLFIYLWLLTYTFFTRKIFKNDFTPHGRQLPVIPFKITSTGIFLLLILQCMIFLFFFIQAGGLVFLRGESSGVIADTKAMRLVIDRVLRSFTTFSAFLFILNYRFRKTISNRNILIVSVMLMTFTNFPFAVPRYMAGAFYIGLFFLVKPYFQKRSIPYIGLLVLFLIVYPATSYFRYLVTLSDYEINLWNPLSFLTGDFDNYSTLNMTITHVQKHDITYGRQFLGVLLFFVPPYSVARKTDWLRSFCGRCTKLGFHEYFMPHYG